MPEQAIVGTVTVRTMPDGSWRWLSPDEERVYFRTVRHRRREWNRAKLSARRYAQGRRVLAATERQHPHGWLGYALEWPA